MAYPNQAKVHLGIVLQLFFLNGSCHMDHLQREKVLVLVFVPSVTDVFLGVFIKGLLAARRAKVIGLAFVFGRACCGCRVNVHTTH